MENKKPRRSGLWFILFKLLPKMGKLAPKFFSTLLKLFKALKGFKLGMAAATFGSYAWMFSWEFALLLMGSIFLHELGHIRAMKAYGMKTKGVYFLPFMGAAAVTEEQFPSLKAEAVIAIWGPVWGLILSMIFFDIYAWTGQLLMAGLAAWCAMVNLFNLLPIKPLDGGRIVSSLTFSLSERLGFAVTGLGLVIAILLFAVTKAGLFGLILVIGAIELGSEWRSRHPNVQGLRKRMIEFMETDEDVQPMVRLLAESMPFTERSPNIAHIANQAFAVTIMRVNHLKWRKCWFYIHPRVLDTCLDANGGYAVFQQIMAGKLEVPEDTRKRPMDALSAAVVFFTTAVVIALLLLIVRTASIDPASQAALQGFIH